MEIEDPWRERQKKRRQRFIEAMRAHGQQAQHAAFVTRDEALQQNEKPNRLRDKALGFLGAGETKRVRLRISAKPQI